MPGMGDEIDGAMQHAPQPARQSRGISNGGIAQDFTGLGMAKNCVFANRLQDLQAYLPPFLQAN